MSGPPIEMTSLTNETIEMSPTSQYMEGVAARGFNRTRMRRNKSMVTLESEIDGRLVNKRSGRLLSTHEGRMSQRSLFRKDFFHSILSAGWVKVLLLFGTTYVVSWFFWACMWYSYNQLDKYVHNRHVNRTGNGTTVVSGTCVDKLEKFNSAMEFSIETSSTIGYGNIYVDPTCHMGVGLLVFQELMARLIDCFWIGLVFLKLARPEKRMNTMRFSKRAAISVLDGEQRLMFRIGDLNPGLNWAATELKLYMFYDGTTKEGVHSSFRQVSLELDVDSVLFVLPLVVSHIITDSSPLWGMTQKDMVRQKVEFILVFEGVVEATGNTLHARTSYVNNEIRWGQFFAETNFRDEASKARVDWTLFDETIPCATFNDTTVYDGNRLGFRRQSIIYEDSDSRREAENETNIDLIDFALPSSASPSRPSSSTPRRDFGSAGSASGQYIELAPAEPKRSGSTSSMTSTANTNPSSPRRSGSTSSAGQRPANGFGAMGEDSSGAEEDDLLLSA